MRVQALAGPAAAAVAIAGCGGTGTLSLSELKDQASHVCAHAGNDTNQIRTPGSPEGMAGFLGRGARALRPELAALRRLKPPAAASIEYRSAIRSLSAEVSALEHTIHGLNRGDDPVTATQNLQHRLGRLESRQDRAWRALQIPACVER